MNTRKSRDRPKHYDESQSYSSKNKPYIYDIAQNNPSNKGKHLRQKTKAIQKDESSYSQKQNESLFKNMQQCNQKMEYYKLMGSLEEQKRAMLEQENHLLKEENNQIKKQIQASQKEIKRLVRKLEKLENQLEKYSDINDSKNRNFIIELPNSHKNNKQKPQTHNKSPSNDYQDDQGNYCEKCIYLEEQLMEQRALYQKDRTYLKEQIQNLTQTLDDSKKQQKIIKKQLTGIHAHYQKKQNDLSEKFRQVQNNLKKQLMNCYEALQEKCDFICELELKIDFFQQENRRIIKLLTIFDGPTENISNTMKKPPAYSFSRQERAKSTNQVKEKPNKFPNFFDSHETSIQQDNSQIIDNRRKARKCGSIKKIEVD